MKDKLVTAYIAGLSAGFVIGVVIYIFVKAIF